MGDKITYSADEADEIADLSAELRAEVGVILRGGYGDINKPRVAELLQKMVPYREVFERQLERYSQKYDSIRHCNLQIPAQSLEGLLKCRVEWTGGGSSFIGIVDRGAGCGRFWFYLPGWHLG